MPKLTQQMEVHAASGGLLSVGKSSFSHTTAHAHTLRSEYFTTQKKVWDTNSRECDSLNAVH